MKQVQLRMDGPTYAELKRAAKAAQESINFYAVKILKAALEPKS
jgi:predicted HicB family RNase H-like nuclease